ncbi:NADH oxidase [Rhizorhabdus dicambivorans]|uniref:NADH oxidase n=1 Tax=Rhizorhabdus dicambivorans TaxID=1850238 RepID=A0A2A4FT43_9SPHN|nr:NADH oxidase [Rhizorhabdus dicambivorans]ATE64738.1 NADH oxidase [Rhizorhabdus dicambivorans]PCE41319.1 NADH oxidase [Rhizorhabdus dicambivorans]
MDGEKFTSVGLRTLITPEGELLLTLEEESIGDISPDEVVIRVEASSMNPTDIGLLLGPADLAEMAAISHNGRPGLRAPIPPEHMSSLELRSRIGKSLPVGTEGAGTVVGAGENAVDLIGKTVSTMSGGMYAGFRRVNAGACTVLPTGTSAKDGASMYVNPLTALSMIETMRREGHEALVHTAAASNLGQMLNRICINDGIPLVNVVRSEEQIKTLRSIGAKYIVNSSAQTFFQDLKAAITATGATLAFDAVAGGSMADTILRAMEDALGASQTAFSRYGTAILKQVYIYGSLNPEPTVLTRTYGSSWMVGRYLVLNALQKFGEETTLSLKNRIVRELSTTFASSYKGTLSLNDVVNPDFAKEYTKKSTGSKFLVHPSL